MRISDWSSDVRSSDLLPFNTDGGGLCNNHPSNRGGLTKVLEAVRQARGEAHPKVQVPNPDLVLAHGTGGSLGPRNGSATVILERACAAWPRGRHRHQSRREEERRGGQGWVRPG